jgi:uncharacterized protein (DUF427 family)
MPRAVLKDIVLAQSESTELVEGNVYFPRESVAMSSLSKSSRRYTCPWKGDATYYSYLGSERTVEDVAWSYIDPKPAASSIAGHLAFDLRKGVEIEETE